MAPIWGKVSSAWVGDLPDHSSVLLVLMLNAILLRQSQESSGDRLMAATVLTFAMSLWSRVTA